MKILADENMQREVVLRLRLNGHDVRWAGETNRSAADLSLLQLATREKRTLITYDTDFGEIIYRGNRQAPYGIILFRLHIDVPEEVRMLFVVGTITSWDPWPAGIWTVQIRHQS